METLIAWLNAERGRVSELAAACKITHSAVSQWKKVPADRIVEIERITGIPREDLRPDLFKRETAA